MATQLQIRRDTATDLASATPVEAEIGYDQTNKNLLVGDGARSGGIPHPSFAQLQSQRFVFGTAGGTGDVITLALNEDLDAYAAGVAVEFIASAANTGAVTLNVSGLGAKDLKKYSGGAEVDLEADDISSGQIIRAIYDGTNFQINAGGGSGLLELVASEQGASAASVTFLNSIEVGFYYEALVRCGDGTTSANNIQFDMRYSGTTYQGYVNCSPTGSGSFTDCHQTVLSFAYVDSADTLGYQWHGVYQNTQGSGGGLYAIRAWDSIRFRLSLDSMADYTVSLYRRALV